jgi:hypothetical protein|tara:strand:- start:49 stop:306 length:258 start_codon:yes stop_codon:yes gene_type:complete
MSATTVTVHDVVNVEVKVVAHGYFTTTRLFITDKDGNEVEVKMFSDNHEIPMADANIFTVEHDQGPDNINHYTIQEWIAKTKNKV